MGDETYHYLKYRYRVANVTFLFLLGYLSGLQHRLMEVLCEVLGVSSLPDLEFYSVESKRLFLRPEGLSSAGLQARASSARGGHLGLAWSLERSQWRGVLRRRVLG